MIQALERAIAVMGMPAKALASALGGVVDIDWEAAISVHRNRVMPRWIALVERSLKNTAAIGPHSLGARQPLLSSSIEDEVLLYRGNM